MDSAEIRGQLDLTQKELAEVRLFFLCFVFSTLKHLLPFRPFDSLSVVAFVDFHLYKDALTLFLVQLCLLAGFRACRTFPPFHKQKPFTFKFCLAAYLEARPGGGVAALLAQYAADPEVRCLS